jgi:hypothetical protein
MTMRREGVITAKQLWDDYNYVDGIEVRVESSVVAG